MKPIDVLKLAVAELAILSVAPTATSPPVTEGSAARATDAEERAVAAKYREERIARKMAEIARRQPRTRSSA